MHAPPCTSSSISDVRALRLAACASEGTPTSRTVRQEKSCFFIELLKAGGEGWRVNRELVHEGMRKKWQAEVEIDSNGGRRRKSWGHFGKE